MHFIGVLDHEQWHRRTCRSHGLKTIRNMFTEKKTGRKNTYGDLGKYGRIILKEITEEKILNIWTGSGYSQMAVFCDDGDEHLYSVTTINIVISSCSTGLRVNSVTDLCYMFRFLDVCDVEAWLQLLALHVEFGAAQSRVPSTTYIRPVTPVHCCQRKNSILFPPLGRDEQGHNEVPNYLISFVVFCRIRPSTHRYTHIMFS